MKGWILLVLTCFRLQIVVSLIGNNICQREEKYKITSNKTVKIPHTVRTFKWCVSIPPRCEEERTEYVFNTQTVDEEKTRYVDECCEGYIEDKTSTRCVSLDCKKCVNGRCNTFMGTCECENGYTGRYCTEKCSIYTWGKNCTNHCSCYNNALCNPINGKCKCTSGWHGQSCDMKCPDGLYGLDCKEKCQCNENSCDHKTGKCQEKVEKNIENTTTELQTSTSPNVLSSTPTKSYDELLDTTISIIQTTTQKIQEMPKLNKTITEKCGKEKDNKNKLKINKKLCVAETAPENMSKTTTPLPVTTTDYEKESDVSKMIDKDNEDTETVKMNSTTPLATTTNIDGDWPMDKPVIPSVNRYINTENRTMINDSERDFISVQCVAAGVIVGVTVVIIVAAIILYSTDRSRQQRKTTAISADKNQRSPVIPTVLFISQSTFHRELTEPVTVISSEFPTANTILRFKSPVSTNEDFDKVYANTLREVFDSTYDHPPSVGTFREVVPKDPEHVYDEIPCWKQPTPVDGFNITSKISSPSDMTQITNEIKHI